MVVHSVDSELYHHGVLGQKWGVRRYQNSDGTLTSEGKEHYSKGLPKIVKSYREGSINRSINSVLKAKNKIASTDDKINIAKAEKRGYKEEFLKAKQKQANAQNKLYKAENSLSTKLFGMGNYQSRKLKKDIEKTTADRNNAERQYLNAKDNVSLLKLEKQKYSDIYNYESSKLRKKAVRYINQYGGIEYSKIVK